MLKELETVVLTEDIPDHHLQSGDVGTIVLVHGEGKGYEVEFVTFGGETIAVLTLLPSQMRRAGNDEMLHVRAAA